jgi:hypothetical protein
VLSILRGADRSNAGQPAPARGLCLVGVSYLDTLVPGGRWEVGAGDWPVR